ncbi:hypothetical protein Salat_2696900 [Sesamum alatum]|uniref:Uncharacterized protein n=1 Tax=Sesamum alatum TaxID=300844 RepID=A0AAE2CBH5_9LAMI|nr:hypothetical protein Salat_2696900 [Sesamum alatum]
MFGTPVERDLEVTGNPRELGFFILVVRALRGLLFQRRRLPASLLPQALRLGRSPKALSDRQGNGPAQIACVSDLAHTSPEAHLHDLNTLKDGLPLVDCDFTSQQVVGPAHLAPHGCALDRGRPNISNLVQGDSSMFSSLQVPPIVPQFPHLSSDRISTASGILTSPLTITVISSPALVDVPLTEHASFPQADGRHLRSSGVYGRRSRGRPKGRGR